MVEKPIASSSEIAHPLIRKVLASKPPIAIMRMIQDGAVPNTTEAMITEWFPDWAGPLAPAAREVIMPFLKETAILQDIYLPEEVVRASDAHKSEKPLVGGKR